MEEGKSPTPRSGRAEKSERSIAKSVGAMLRAAREARGLSQEQVASLTEGGPGQISRTAISDIECGRHLPSIEAVVSLSRVLHVESAEIIERVDLAMAVPIDLTGLSVDDLENRAEKLFLSGDYRNALTVYDGMIERLALDPPRDEMQRVRRLAKVEITRASALRRLSALKAARACAERATELAQDIPELRAEAYMVLASLHSHEGLHGLALDAAKRAIELSEAGSAKLKGHTWSQKGAVLHRARDFGAGREAYLHARKHALAAQDHRRLIVIEGGLGGCLIGLGDREKARSHLMKAIGLARKHADPEGEALWLAGLGRLMYDLGRLDEAERYTGDSLRIARPAARKLTIFLAEWIRHLIARRRDPHNPDTKRLSELRRLYTRLKSHRGLDQVQEFKEMIIDNEQGGSGDHGE